MLKLTALAYRDTSDGGEDALEKRAVIVNPEHIQYMIQIDLKRNIPVIGEENLVKATQLSFRKDPALVVSETLEEIAELL